MLLQGTRSWKKSFSVGLIKGYWTSAFYQKPTHQSQFLFLVTKLLFMTTLNFFSAAWRVKDWARVLVSSSNWSFILFPFSKTKLQFHVMTTPFIVQLAWPPKADVNSAVTSIVPVPLAPANLPVPPTNVTL